MTQIAIAKEEAERHVGPCWENDLGYDQTYLSDCIQKAVEAASERGVKPAKTIFYCLNYVLCELGTSISPSRANYGYRPLR